jgi:DNA-binding response OmpR family regulator
VAGAEPSVRAVIQMALNTGRFDLSEVEDGARALELAQELRPELVFLDWSLDAGELCRRFRGDPATADSKIVILVDWTEEDAGESVLEAGADDVITKPFSPLQLVVKVRHLLGPEALAG